MTSRDWRLLQAEISGDVVLAYRPGKRSIMAHPTGWPQIEFATLRERSLPGNELQVTKQGSATFAEHALNQEVPL
jgi:hypothetical protein